MSYDPTSLEALCTAYMGGVTLPILEQDGMVPVVKASADSIGFEYKTTQDLGITEPVTDTLYRGGWRIYEGATLYSDVVSGTPNALHFIEGVGIIRAANANCYRLCKYSAAYIGNGSSQNVAHTNYGVADAFIGGSMPALGTLTTSIVGGNVRTLVTGTSGSESGLKLYYRIWTFA